MPSGESGSPHPAGPADRPRIGRYELLAKLGEGGMGVVHLARGADGHRVALKVLRDHVVGDEEGRSRLAREVTTLRRVRSPRIAEVYDADPWGDRPFVVTRYVPGQSLHRRVADEGPLPDQDLRFLALGLAEAMVAVHDGGVLHRDIKPSNVLLEGRAPVLIDFGLAKLADDARLTVTGWLMGTPGYLAPEVLYGDDPTPASDVHAWAATVVYAACGTSPYGSGPAMAVMDRARLGQYDVSALPADLRPLVARSLSADPSARPSGPELVARLAQMQAPPNAGVHPAAPQPPPSRAPGTRPLTVPVANHGAPPLPRRPPPAQPMPHSRPMTHPDPMAAPPRLDRPPSRSSSRALRIAMTVGLLSVVAALVAWAPYVGTALMLVVVWLVRTASVNADAHEHRRALRGPRRSDGVLRTLAWPWHLFVAVWGSVSLVVVAALAGGVTAAFAALVGQPDARCVLLGGLAFALLVWVGPGSGRLRYRTRRLVWRVATPSQAGIACTLAVWLVAVVLVIVRTYTGVLWDPATDAPFDALLGPLSL